MLGGDTDLSKAHTLSSGGSSATTLHASPGSLAPAADRPAMSRPGHVVLSSGTHKGTPTSPCTHMQRRSAEQPHARLRTVPSADGTSWGRGRPGPGPPSTSPAAGSQSPQGLTRAWGSTSPARIGEQCSARRARAGPPAGTGGASGKEQGGRGQQGRPPLLTIHPTRLRTPPRCVS